MKPDINPRTAFKRFNWAGGVGQSLLSIGVMLAATLTLTIPAVTWSESVQHKTRPSFDETIWKDFGLIPVQADGRIKPLETFATQVLIQLSGRARYKNRSALMWLADLLFIPETTKNDQVFLINEPAVAISLGLDPEPKHRYSFQQLNDRYATLVRLAQQAANIEQKQRDHAEQEILRVHQALSLYSGLSKAFSFTRPHPHFTIHDVNLKRTLNLDEKTETMSYLDIALAADRLLLLSEDLLHKPRTLWSDKEREIVALMRYLKEWPSFYRDIPFKIIPPSLVGQTNDEAWIHPWEGVPSLFQNPQGRQIMVLLSRMQRAYENNNPKAFHDAVLEYRRLIRHQITSDQQHVLSTFVWERVLNRYHPFLWAMGLYLLAAMAGWLVMKRDSIFWLKTTIMLIGLGVFAHVGGLAIRVFILKRPPVSTLYETLLFVSLIIILIGLISSRFFKNMIALTCAALSAGMLIMLSTRFSVSGDTLKVLTAVLNSNFWLLTHVLTITTGYAGVIFAGVVAHFILINRIRRPNEKPLVLEKLMWIGLAFGLFFSFIGTNLGGVWADQSWGRFWGWDPKENGALMIILWVAAMFHARWAKMIGTTAAAVMGVMALMIVIWAWFGINLLSVGLHSYGFTSGLQMGLSLYYGAEVLFLTGVFFGVQYVSRRRAAIVNEGKTS